MDDLKIRFVIASRESRDGFFNSTAAGKFLQLYDFPFIELDLYPENSEGLPTAYNQSIEKAKSDPAILVFTHDDIYLSDFYWADRVVNGLEHYDVIGVAGNKRRLPKQPAWPFVDDQFTWDDPSFLSGIVAHGFQFPHGALTFFGDSCQEVKLLDGVFLAVRSELLHSRDLRFDEQFDFHFYDMDFCRSAEEKDISMGTWAISLVHESGGSFGSPEWKRNKTQYFQKWGEL